LQYFRFGYFANLLSVYIHKGYLPILVDLS